MGEILRLRSSGPPLRKTHCGTGRSQPKTDALLQAALCHSGFATTQRRLPDGSTVEVVVEGESRILMGPQRPGSPDMAVAVGDDRESLRFTYDGFLRFCSRQRGFCHRVGQAIGLPGVPPQKITGFIVRAQLSGGGGAQVIGVSIRLEGGGLVDLESLEPSAGAGG
jgi:hypothetical protein